MLDLGTRACILMTLSALGFGVVGCAESSSDATATELGIIAQSSTIDGRDGAGSGFAFGHSVWTFGDTVLSLPDQDGQNWHHNSFSFTDDREGSDGVSGLTEPLDSAGAPQYFLAPTDDEKVFNEAHHGDACMTPPCNERFAVWPGAPIWDDKRQRALIFYGLIHGTGSGFDGVGSSIAVWSDFASPPARPIFNPSWDHPTMMFAAGEPGWGTGALIDGDDLYALECDTSDLDAPCAMAKVALEDALDRSRWSFFDGAEWSTEVSKRAKLFSGGSSVSLAKNHYLGKYTAIYAGPFSNQVMIRTAASLTGPWSSAKLLFVANRKPEGAYDANVHSEYEEQGGRVQYVSFTRPNGQGIFGSEIAWVKVTLP
jgi:Domain of unknown function (DUF4185)